MSAIDFYEIWTRWCLNTPDVQCQRLGFNAKSALNMQKFVKFRFTLSALSAIDFIFGILSDLRRRSVIINGVHFWSESKGLKMKTYTMTWKMYGKTDAPEVTDLDDTRDILVTCDECGNTTTTRHFWCGEFLPISMYCVRCRKHVAAHARYVDV